MAPKPRMVKENEKANVKVRRKMWIMLIGWKKMCTFFLFFFIFVSNVLKKVREKPVQQSHKESHGK